MTHLMTIGEVAHLFGVDPKTVKQWGIEGRFGEVVKTLGGHRRFHRERVEQVYEETRERSHGS